MTGPVRIPAPPADDGLPGEVVRAWLVRVLQRQDGLGEVAGIVGDTINVARDWEMWAAAEWSYDPPAEIRAGGWTDRKAAARASERYDPLRPWRGLMSPDRHRLVTALEAAGLYTPHAFAAPLARQEEERER